MTQQTSRSGRLETIELETRDSPSHAVIWLHGLGADGNDFVPIVEQLSLKGPWSEAKVTSSTMSVPQVTLRSTLKAINPRLQHLQRKLVGGTYDSNLSLNFYWPNRLGFESRHISMC